MSQTTSKTEWVVVVSLTNEAGEVECFVATEGFDDEDAALSFICDNHTAYDSDWLVEAATAEEAAQVVTM